MISHHKTRIASLKTIFFHFILPLVLSLFFSNASAAVVNWIDGVGAWDVPGNWDAGVPGVADIAVIDNGGTAIVGVVPVPGPNAVFVGSNGGMIVNPGGTFFTGGLNVGLGSGQGTLTANGAAILFATNLIVNAIPNAANQSVVNIINGSLANFNTIILNFFTATSATLNVSDSVLEMGTMLTLDPTVPAAVTFNNSTLRLLGDYDMFQFFTPLQTFTINVGGVVIDTNGFNNVTISSAFPGLAGVGGLTKIGAGTLTLNSINTYTGDTVVNGGQLILGDVNTPTARVAGNLIVNPGGTLAGFGTVGANLTNSGGIVSPGASIGTITVLGNYVQSATGSYIAQVDQAGNSDLLNITGTATLNGIVGVSAINNGFLRYFPYTILTAGGGVIGTFSNTNIDGIFNQGFLQGRVLYFPNMVQFLVDFNAAAFRNAYETPNQRAVGDNILLTGGNPQIQSLIASLSTADQFRRAMDQLSGATYADNDMMIAQVGNTFSGEMADRFDAFPSCNCRTSLLPGGGRRGCDQRNQFWVVGHGAEDRIRSGQVSGLNTDVGNFALGYEWAAGRNGKVGVGAAYSDFSARAQTREMARTTGNLYQIGLYARNQMGNWLLGAAVDAGVTSDLDTERRIDGTFRTVTTKGSSKAHLYSEQIRLGYDLAGNRPMRFSPFVGVIGQQLNRNAFAENTTTGFELNVDGSNYRSTRSQLGAMLEFPTNSSFKPFVSADWEHEFSDVNSTFNANFVGLGGKFHIEGQDIGRDSALVKAGTVIACGRNWSVAALYQGWYGSGWQENGGTLEATVAFG